MKKIFLGGLKKDIVESDIQEYFATFGTVLKIDVITEKKTGKNRGFAFVEFDDYDVVDKILCK